jgi:hypothetical protein
VASQAVLRTHTIQNEVSQPCPWPPLQDAVHVYQLWLSSKPWLPCKFRYLLMRCWPSLFCLGCTVGNCCCTLMCPAAAHMFTLAQGLGDDHITSICRQLAIELLCATLPAACSASPRCCVANPSMLHRNMRAVVYVLVAPTACGEAWHAPGASLGTWRRVHALCALYWHG